MKKYDDPFIYQNLGLRRGHSFTRGVKMGPFSVAHPKYLLSPDLFILYVLDFGYDFRLYQRSAQWLTIIVLSICYLNKCPSRRRGSRRRRRRRIRRRRWRRNGDAGGEAGVASSSLCNTILTFNVVPSQALYLH